jgi:predicted DNA-binding transcriptional regulator AlpA
MMQATTFERLVTLTELAQRLGVSLNTARRIRTQLRPVRIGRHIRYPESEISEFILRGGMRPPSVDYKALAAGDKPEA